jgi:hypothetical protein
MSKAKFTPGPWKREGRYIMFFSEMTGYDWLAKVEKFADQYKEEEAANAALIAAAPDLLAALEEMMIHAEYFFPHKEGFERANAAYDAAERAILKAYGKQ